MKSVPKPKYLDLLGHTYEVVDYDCTELQNYLNPKDKREVKSDGYFSHETQKIYIWPTLPSSLKLQTLIHEIFHAIEFHTTNDGLFDTDDQREFIIEVMSSGIYQSLTRNDILDLWK